MKNLIILILLLNITTLYSQTLKGHATYGVKRIDKALTKNTIGLKKMIQKIDEGLENIEFILDFSGTESFYSYLEKVLVNEGLGLQLAIEVAGGRHGKYVNSTTKEILSIKKIDGKKFIVKSSLKNLNWKLVNELKKIGKYDCYKAVTEIRIEKKENEFVNEKITAWYTPKIPVSFGPNGYGGLPGLILELYDSKKVTFLKTVNLKPTKRKITKPNKGKVITEKEYNEINKNSIFNIKNGFD